ncbi:filamentous hemagglutinin N-terminal domain-containing protein [Nostoc sp. TCL26-01]|uniref:two-partner secretion domain-containing protein n=1 Tax=Nostoc sp. TCL26-01 TaxID=2576904 RepID=UPI0015B8C6E6|nr:filamentous hemagglutinin N-terminal domain-containing protein [Nostoc sp. TCL26-01]QLE56020.1 filamentous hemagglutinin N-terminal domain-containing protein [Nostoc sp. TCL26-01]
MTTSSKSFTWQWSVASRLVTAAVLAVGIVFPDANSAYAQSVIIPDQTLGSEGSRVESNSINGRTEVLQGGAIRNNNLFHSFLEFNVNEGRAARFLVPNADIQNVLVRVTGSNQSQILGQLEMLNSNANLFLLNPNGITFGSNARLKINGSFVASTASAINFADGSIFSTTSPATTLPLKVNVPTGLQFGKTGGEIRLNRQSTLQVQAGKTLALVGGNIIVDGGYLLASSGQIGLGGIRATGTIDLNLDSNHQPLKFSSDSALADVSITNGGIVFASDQRGGSIQIQGRNVLLTGGSQVFAQTANQDGGEISIQTEQLIVQGGSQVSASTFGGGKGGNLAVNATDFILVTGTDADGFASSLRTNTYNRGSAGKLTVKTRKLIVENGGQIEASARRGSQGLGGQLEVMADVIKLSGSSLNGFSSGLFAQTGGTNDAGSLTIKTRQLIIQDGAQIVAGTQPGSQGKGGNLNIHASDFIEISGTAPNRIDTSGLFVRSQGEGDAGSLSITTGKLIVSNQAQVTVSALGRGNAGKLEINANEIRLDEQGKLFAQTISGKGGDINIKVTDLLLLRNHSQISATAGTNATSQGDGGNINIDAPNGFIVAVPSENSDISANAFQGKGGNVDINAFGVFGTQFREKLTDLSDITASSEFGLNGTVEINTPEVDPSEGVVNLPTQPVETKLAQVCYAGFGRNRDSFTITGRGGLPDNPTDFLNADAVLANWIAIGEPEKTVSRTTVPPMPSGIVEATGWTRNAQGEVVLTAKVSVVTPHASWQQATVCQNQTLTSRDF